MVRLDPQTQESVTALRSMRTKLNEAQRDSLTIDPQLYPQQVQGALLNIQQACAKLDHVLSLYKGVGDDDGQ